MKVAVTLARIVDGVNVINESNEGHIMVKITNEGVKTMKVAKGDGFCQGIFLPYGITEDDKTEGTRNGGFGSTDK